MAERTLLEVAQDELADSMAPFPEDFMETYSPPAAFLFLRQCAMVALKIATGAAASLAGEADETEPVAVEVLNGIAMCVAGATHALVSLDVLPREAEEAMAGEPEGLAK